MFRVDPLANPEALIKRVYAYVAYRVGDGPDAEDLTSETFERALRYKKSYDSSKGEPIAWLIGIARRCVEGRPASLELASEVVEAVDHRDLEDDPLRRIALSGAVGRLEERDEDRQQAETRQREAADGENGPRRQRPAGRSLIRGLLGGTCGVSVPRSAHPRRIRGRCGLHRHLRPRERRNRNAGE